jgi:membrane protein DedA with SNARE-associated domain
MSFESIRLARYTVLMGFVTDFLLQHGYSLIVIWIFAEQLGFPIPSTPVLLSAGALAGRGHLSLMTALTCVVTASVAADLIWYQLGRRKGKKILKFLCKISLQPDSCVRRTTEIYAKQGARSLLLAKFVPGLNAAASPLAGIINMSFRRFLLFDIAGTLAWAGVFTGMGYLLSSEILRAIQGIGVLAGKLVALLGSGLAGYILYKYFSRRRFIRQLRVVRIQAEELKQKLDSGESPVIIDLRNAFEFAADPESIPGAVRIDASALERGVDLFPHAREVILYCT